MISLVNGNVTNRTYAFLSLCFYYIPKMIDINKNSPFPQYLICW